MTDFEHLQAYVRHRTDADFSAIVTQHIGLVFGSAMRQTRNAALAQEVTQAVFLDLALHAAKLRRDTQLASWLCVVTRRTAVDFVRREVRLHRREQVAADLASMHTDDQDWARVEPVIDEALASLDELDRRAVLLRFFENRSLREIGTALSVSDDAAQKRVTRALERLRDLLRRRGITTTAAALGAGLTASAQVAVPAGVISAVNSSVALTVTAVSSAAAAGALTASGLALTTKALLATAGIAAASALAFQGSMVRDRDRDIARLQGNAQAQHAENAELRHAREQALAELQLMRERLAQSPTLASKPADDFDAHLGVIRENIRALQEMLALAPEQDSPDLAELSKDDWVTAVIGRRLDTTEDFRRVLSTVRGRAKWIVFQRLYRPFTKWVEDHGGALPANLDGYIATLGSDRDKAFWARFEIVAQGNLFDLDPKTPIIRERVSGMVDPELDSSVEGRVRGSGTVSSPLRPGSVFASMSAAERALSTEMGALFDQAIKTYRKSHGGALPPSLDAVYAHFKSPEDAARYRAYQQERRKKFPTTRVITDPGSQLKGNVQILRVP